MLLERGVKRHILMPDGSNAFKVLIDKLTLFQSKLLQKSEDTDAFNRLILVRYPHFSLLVVDI